MAHLPLGALLYNTMMQEAECRPPISGYAMSRSETDVVIAPDVGMFIACSTCKRTDA